jgi:ArsR family transcriptional regulator, arsenate/arsenite/antimonite-responsive transcriptional repressor
MSVRSRLDVGRAARLFHALSDETRLRILERLRRGERCVCELTDALDAAQSRLSFHLRILKEAGLVTDRRDGRWAYYALNPDALGEAGEVIGDLAPGAGPPARAASSC